VCPASLADTRAARDLHHIHQALALCAYQRIDPSILPRASGGRPTLHGSYHRIREYLASSGRAERVNPDTVARPWSVLGPLFAQMLKLAFLHVVSFVVAWKCEGALTGSMMA
jgi:hypothetical protein